MNKRTLLIALVLMSAVCAYASTVTIIYPTPVEGLDTHLANTTTAHDTANTNATLASHASSLATLSADVIARAGINGSTTQNFSVATLTAWGNLSAPNQSHVMLTDTAQGTINTATITTATYTAETGDPLSEMTPTTGAFSNKNAGWYLVTGHADWAANPNGYRFLSLNLPSTVSLANTSQAESGTDGTSQTISWCGYLSAGSGVFMRLYQTSGVPIAVTAGLSVIRLH